MPYTHVNSRGQTYVLHGMDVTLLNGRRQRIYYSAPIEKPGEVLDAAPEGHVVVGNPRTGLPYLKRGRR